MCVAGLVLCPRQTSSYAFEIASKTYKPATKIEHLISACTVPTSYQMSSSPNVLRTESRRSAHHRSSVPLLILIFFNILFFISDQRQQLGSRPLHQTPIRRDHLQTFPRRYRGKHGGLRQSVRPFFYPLQVGRQGMRNACITIVCTRSHPIK
jgi:hypothetical protein